MPASHDAGIHNETIKTNILTQLLMRNDDAVNIVIKTEDASCKQECLRNVE